MGVRVERNTGAGDRERRGAARGAHAGHPVQLTSGAPGGSSLRQRRGRSTR
jgi:hypothetical protein